MMGFPDARIHVHRSGRSVCIRVHGVLPHPEARLRVRGRLLAPTFASMNADPAEFCFDLPQDGPQTATLFFWTPDADEVRDVVL